MRITRKNGKKIHAQPSREEQFKLARANNKAMKSQQIDDELRVAFMPQRVASKLQEYGVI